MPLMAACASASTAHLDEAEALRAAGVTVHHDLGGRDGAEFGEKLHCSDSSRTL
jgi:hypothetical protein